MNVSTGCTKKSPGCKNCYAKTMAHRLQAMGAPGYENGFELRLQPQRMNDPLRRMKPTTYFINSMSDLFHAGIPDDYIDKVFDVIAKTPQHTYQMLTKREERLVPYFTRRRPPRNAWIGVSVENKAHGVPRIDQLRQVPANVRFLSIEPLLEDVGQLDLTGIHWVIVGGESGPEARCCDVAWIRNVVRQCRAAGVPVFVKQLGAHVIWDGMSGPLEHWPPGVTRMEDTGQGMFRVRLANRKGGDWQEWPEDLRIREFPKLAGAQLLHA